MEMERHATETKLGIAGVRGTAPERYDAVTTGGASSTMSGSTVAVRGGGSAVGEAEGAGRGGDARARKGGVDAGAGTANGLEAALGGAAIRRVEGGGLALGGLIFGSRGDAACGILPAAAAGAVALDEAGPDDDAVVSMEQAKSGSPTHFRDSSFQLHGW